MKKYDTNYNSKQLDKAIIYKSVSEIPSGTWVLASKGEEHHHLFFLCGDNLADELQDGVFYDTANQECWPVDKWCDYHIFRAIFPRDLTFHGDDREAVGEAV